MSCRALIVDDHAGFRSWAQRLLASDGYDAVGQVGDRDQALAETHLLRPELVLVDVQLPDGSGFDVAKEQGAAVPNCSIVLMSTRRADPYATEIAGTSGKAFLEKASLTPEAMARVIGEDG